MNIAASYTYSGLRPDIERHLSVIGKRATNNAGENIFSKITLSSAEWTILTQYMQQASQNVVAVIEQFVSGYTETDTGVSFNVTNTRWNDPNTPSFVATFSPAYKKYVVMYTLAEYLSMNFPEYAKKYYDAAQQALTAIIRLVFFKAPVPESDATGPSSTVEPKVPFYTKRDTVQTSQFDFYVPLSFVINTAEKWGTITITHYNVNSSGEQTESTSSISMYRNNETTPLFQSGNSFTGHTTIGSSGVAYLIENQNSIGENVVFKYTSSARNLLVISWTEQD